MSFQYTDKQLNALNFGENVYSVNTDFAIRKDFEIITNKDIPNIGETNKVQTPDGQSFQVIKVLSDPNTGFDGMAVAPIRNGKVDFGSVAVIASATDPEAKNTEIPLLSDINPNLKLSRDVLTAISGTRDKDISNGTYLSPQYPVAEAFVKEVMEDKRVEKVIHLSGYSQSAYMLKVGAKFGIPTTTFNAWFRYDSLSDREKTVMKNNSWMFRDYRNNKDKVVVIQDGNNPYLFGYDDRFGTIYWQEGSSHNISDWVSYDEKTGQVINPKTGLPFVSATATAIQTAFKDLASFRRLKDQWAGGGISSSEELFLDAAQTYVLGNAMSKAATAGLEELTALKTRDEHKVEAIWSKVDFSIYSELAPWEVEAIFASHKVTYNQIVGDFHDYTEKIVAKMSDLERTFNTLKNQLDEVVTEKLTLDNQLAGEFKTWFEEL